MFVASLSTGGLVLLSESVAEAASFVAPPERLYMAPTGTTLVAELAGVPITTLAFDGGTDVISSDIRTIDDRHGQR